MHSFRLFFWRFCPLGLSSKDASCYNLTVNSIVRPCICIIPPLSSLELISSMVWYLWPNEKSQTHNRIQQPDSRFLGSIFPGQRIFERFDDAAFFLFVSELLVTGRQLLFQALLLDTSRGFPRCHVAEVAEWREYVFVVDWSPRVVYVFSQKV